MDTKPRSVDLLMGERSDTGENHIVNVLGHRTNISGEVASRGMDGHVVHTEHYSSDEVRGAGHNDGSVAGIMGKTNAGRADTNDILKHPCPATNHMAEQCGGPTSRRVRKDSLGRRDHFPPQGSLGENGKDVGGTLRERECTTFALDRNDGELGLGWDGKTAQWDGKTA